MPELRTKKVEVTVHLDLNHKPEFYFTTDVPTKPGKKDNLIFKKGGPDGFTIRYRLADPDHLYTFGTDPNEALYSSETPVCPVPKGHWDQFLPLAIEDSGLTLVVHNKNDCEQEFGYMLRVIKNGGKYRDLDPVGTNQNGNTQGFTFTALAVLVAGGAAGFVAAKAAVPLASDAAVLAATAGVALAALGVYFLAQNRSPRTA